MPGLVDGNIGKNISPQILLTGTSLVSIGLHQYTAALLDVRLGMRWRITIVILNTLRMCTGFAITRSWLMGFTTGAVSAFVLIGLDKLMDLEAK